MYIIEKTFIPFKIKNIKIKNIKSMAKIPLLTPAPIKTECTGITNPFLILNSIIPLFSSLSIFSLEDNKMRKYLPVKSFFQAPCPSIGLSANA